ncbi:MAG: hypothetical protein LBM62_06570 [Mediterranea sp.]|jgi:hypothetical protein|nr:hypothetical protein [Mediterranea sp.]
MEKKKQSNRLLMNVLLLVAGILLVSYALTKQPAYHWVYSGLLKQNMELIRKHPKATFDQKMQMKLGASYEYLLYIKQETPKDAVILYPTVRAFKKAGSPFTQEIFNKIYATRFLYPRKLVTEDELTTNKYADKITHVAIVNGEGRQHLSYPVDSTYQHAVLPVTPH